MKQKVIRLYTIELFQDEDFNLTDYFFDVAGNCSDTQSAIVRVSKAFKVPKKDEKSVLRDMDNGISCIPNEYKMEVVKK
jgi:hypothetical protein